VTVYLTVLGSSGAWPEPGGANSGYLVRHDGFSAWIDAGTGTFANLQRHVPHHRLDVVLVSHEHLDHCLDLYPLFTARHFHPEPLPPLPLISPEGVFERIAALEDAEGVEEMRRVFDVREVSPGDAFEVGPFRVQTRLTPHWVPNIGMRLEADGAVLGYTGDTGPTEAIEELARDADLLVTEASWLGSAEGRPPYHLTAGQAAEHARRAGARRLLLSHFWPGNDRDVAREEAQRLYDGELVVADEGMGLEVGS
jgi:ribonuclease BN (tRNA processing enzyme)